MKRFGLLGSSALCSFAFIGASVGLAAPAYAQDDTATDCTTLPTQAERDECAARTTSADGAATDDGTLYVTGSRIARPNLESTVPITSVQGSELFETGRTSVGDVLNELPQLRSTFGQSNAGQFLGTTGLNLLDLRGLGTSRTLVLVNGRRHVAADILNNAVSPDVNTIPSDLIERIDVVTGGNSAIYGSDAIAGVVNFVLKRDFHGAQVRGQAGISKYGDGASYVAAAMLGRNFADGRGNVVLHGEYAHTDIIFGADRPFIATNTAFVQVDSDPGGTPNGSDGNPDRLLLVDVRGATIASNGMFSLARGVATPACGVGFNALTYHCNFLFDTTGTVLTAQTGLRIGAGPNGAFVGGNGPTNREENLITLLPEYDRYSVNLLGHFTVADAIEPFVEAKYTKTRSYGRSSGPVFLQGSTRDANRERIRLDNPFLSPQARDLLRQQILAAGVDPNSQTGAPPALTAAQIAQINAGTFRVGFRKNFTDLGVRNEDIDRETWRIVSGLRGEFNDDWHYEISANYGKFKERNEVQGNVVNQRLLLALDAGIDPATGQIRCRSQFDPAAAFAFTNSAAAANQAALAAEIAACVPYNPFGRSNNQAAADYILEDTISHANLSQFVVNAFMSGDSSQAFELPGGPIGFALGVEYRREKAFFKTDGDVEAGRTFYNALPTFEPNAFTVKEAFAEIRLPILKDTPFFQELTLSGAARVAKYQGDVGTVFAYNAGLDWAPVTDLRFRANYSRAVRAPNLSETSFPLTQNFAPGFQDPCRPQNIGSGTTFRQTNCQNDLGSLLPSIAGLPAYSLEILSGSNPDLIEETSDSWTVGGVFQPRFVPGFSLAVDYFDIEVKDIITSLSAQTIVNTCYDLPDLNNQFCALFERFRGTGAGPRNEIPGQILQQDMIVIPLNFASRRARGVDVEAAYRKDLGGLGRLSTKIIYTHMFQRDNFNDPSNPDFANQILRELGDPQDAFNWNVDLKTGPVTFGYQMRYIGRMVTNLYEDFFPKQGRPPQDADWASIRFYPEVLYHDARISFDATNKFNFYIGVDNIANRRPPLGVTGIGDGSAIYDNRGRFFYAGVVAKY